MDFQNSSSEGLLVKGDYPKLTRKEQTALHDLGTLKARDKLIQSVIPWAIRLASRFAKRGTLFEDLISHSLIGVIVAVDKWDPKRGALITLATVYCRREMLRALVEENSIIRVPAGQFWKGNRGKLSGELQEKVEKARAIHYPDQKNVLGVSQEVEERQVGSLELQENQRQEDWEKILGVESVLSSKEMETLGLIASGWSMRKIGERIGVTRQRIAQLKIIAIGKLQKELNRKGCENESS